MDALQSRLYRMESENPSENYNRRTTLKEKLKTAVLQTKLALGLRESEETQESGHAKGWFRRCGTYDKLTGYTMEYKRKAVSFVESDTFSEYEPYPIDSVDILAEKMIKNHEFFQEAHRTICRLAVRKWEIEDKDKLLKAYDNSAGNFLAALSYMLDRKDAIDPSYLKAWDNRVKHVRETIRDFPIDDMLDVLSEYTCDRFEKSTAA